jgi:spermidine synthase
MQGHLGIFYRPEAKRALVLGSGYGITAGAMGLYPGLERIDAVEILPAMVNAAGRFVPYNFSYHRNPKIQVHVDDGRHFLSRITDRYDIISVNVSDPHLPGGSALFHRDFYKIAKLHLNPGGVIVQHAFGAEAPIVLSTLLDSFRYARFFPSYANGYNVVVSDSPLDLDEARVKALVAAPRVREGLETIGFHEPIAITAYLTHALRPNRGKEAIDESLIATDDRPRIEFAWTNDFSNLLFSNE